MSTAVLNTEAPYFIRMKSRGGLPKNQNWGWKNQRMGKPVATDLIKLTKFYPAEDYHQNYHTKIQCVIITTVMGPAVIKP